MEAVIPYIPRDAQKEIHDKCDSYRFGTVVAHRRFGKSVCFANELIRRALATERKDWRGAFIGPTYSQAKSILWDELKRYTQTLPRDFLKFNESELRVDFGNGSRVRLFSNDNKGDDLRGLYFDTVVFDEFDLCHMSTWTEAVRPAISDRLGCAYFIGTFKHVDGPLGHVFDQAGSSDDWFRSIYKASETNHVDPKELEANKTVLSTEEYAREYECIRVAAVKGAIFGKALREIEEQDRITNVPYDPGVGVTTSWDLGIGDSTAVWFVQQVGQEVRLIDYYENSGEGLPHYAKVLQDRGYVYKDHIAPHDIGVRELGTGRSRLEVAQELGINFRVLPRVSQSGRSELDERIEAGRRLLARCWFDEEKTDRGMEALRSWHRAENARTGELSPSPVHDWASHGADAFSYLAMGIREHRAVSRPKVASGWVY